MTGTFDALAIGETFETPAVDISAENAADVIRLGGYTHPLFTDHSFAASSPLGRTPLPGQAVLLLMGGLVEQSNRFDDTVIALVGFASVRFIAPAFAGDSLRVRVTVDEKESRAGGARGLMTMTWQCVNGREESICEARAQMLFRCD